MPLTGQHLRDACGLLRWDRYDLQRATALPLTAIDRALASSGPAGDALLEEIILKDALLRAGVELTLDGPRLRKDRA